jgi:GST-like protein
MIDLYYWTPPNDHKIRMFLEKAGMTCALESINIAMGAQFSPNFSRSGNNPRPQDQ